MEHPRDRDLLDADAVANDVAIPAIGYGELPEGRSDGMAALGNSLSDRIASCMAITAAFAARGFFGARKLAKRARSRSA